MQTTKNLTISPITANEDGSYIWEINGETYWTDTEGQGLFTSTYSETTNSLGQTWMHGEHNKQLAGTSQFSLAGLSASARRGRVIHLWAKSNHAYDSFLRDEDMTDTIKSAQLFYRLYKEGYISKKYGHLLDW